MSRNRIDRQLTALQVSLAGEVLSFSLAQGFSPRFELAGSSESFVLCEVGPVTVFLYADAFDLQGDGLDVRFEPDDIGTLDEATMSLRESLKQSLTF